jgi:DNA-binding NtrC family response regulator
MSYKPKVVVVEDEVCLGNSLRRFLSIVNSKITTVCSDEEARELLSRKHLDLALLDVLLPGINGFQVMDYINTKRSNTNVILMRGYTPTDSTRESLLKGPMPA